MTQAQPAMTILMESLLLCCAILILAYILPRI